MSALDVPDDAVVDFAVRFGRETVHVSLPLTSSLLELKMWLETRTGVATHKQRLLFNLPVPKELRRDHVDTTRIAHLLPPSLLQKLREYAMQHHSAQRPDTSTTTTTAAFTPQHVSISAMLVGSVEQASQIDSKATSEVARLVSSTVEFAGRWYRCSYEKGYVRQTAFVCRTCVNEGRAEAGHALCLACSEMCHGGHEVEEWGVRSFMRCDCCTARCWRNTPNKAAAASLPTGATPATTTTANTIHADMHRSTNSDRAVADHTTGSDASGSSSPSTATAVAAVKDVLVSLPSNAVLSSTPSSSPSSTVLSDPISSSATRTAVMQAVVVTNADVVDRARHKRSRSSSSGGRSSPTPAESLASAALAIVPSTAASPGAPSVLLFAEPTTGRTGGEDAVEISTTTSSSAEAAAASGVTLNARMEAMPTIRITGVAPSRENEEVKQATTGCGQCRVTTPPASSHTPEWGNEESVTLNIKGNCAHTDVGNAADGLTASSTAAAATPSSSFAASAAALPAPSAEPHTRCLFVLDRETGKPPVSAILPTNRKNRYPRDVLQWCYCKEDSPNDDPECGGISCMLCTSCFWSSHVTRLHTNQMRRVACYGDVEQGDTVVFRCHTCNTFVCPPCRHRCHREHQCDLEPIVLSGNSNGTYSSNSGTGDEGQEDELRSVRLSSEAVGGSAAGGGHSAHMESTPGVVFSCGCRGLCSIAERVPEEELQDPESYTAMSDKTATAMMNNDTFTAFVCAHCMQEYPWLMTEDPMRCFGGVLPPCVTDTEKILPVIACGGAGRGSACGAEEQQAENNASANSVNHSNTKDSNISNVNERYNGMDRNDTSDCELEGVVRLGETGDAPFLDGQVCTFSSSPVEPPPPPPQQPPVLNDANTPTSTEYFPYHGMLVPSNMFMEGATCACAPCRAAYDALAPRSDKTATEMIVELHDRCDNCQASIKDRQAFMCITCETALAKTFFICSECNALRQRLIDAQHRIHPAGVNRQDRASVAASSFSVVAQDHGTPTGEQSAPCDTVDAASSVASVRAPAPCELTAEPHSVSANEESHAVTPAYHHELSHEFFEDTVQNLYTLCGMQVINNIDANARAELMEQLGSMPEGSDLGVTDAICDVFGQTPIQLDAEEMTEFATLNRVASKSITGKSSAIQATANARDSAPATATTTRSSASPSA